MGQKRYKSAAFFKKTTVNRKKAQETRHVFGKTPTTEKKYNVVLYEIIIKGASFY